MNTSHFEEQIPKAQCWTGVPQTCHSYLQVNVALVVIKHSGTGYGGLNEGHQTLLGFLTPVAVVDVVAVQLGHKSVALAKLGLQVLGTAQAYKACIHHDGDPRAQGVTLFHAVKQ